MREAAKKKKKWASTALALALFGLLPLALRVAAAPEEIRCEYTGNLTLAAYDFTQEPPTALIRNEKKKATEVPVAESALSIWLFLLS